MNKIIVDLEFCKIAQDRQDIRKICKLEVIQFGAVKLDDDDIIVSRFECYVKPKYSHIDEIVAGLTNISDATVKDADGFEMVFEQFLDWIGGEEFRIFSWGIEDLTVIKNECRLKKIKGRSVKMMSDNWIDLQEEISKMLGISQKISLANAITAGGLIFEGRQHDAMADAENTAKIYLLSRNKKKFNKVMSPVIDIFKAKEELTYSLGSLLEGISVE